MTAPPEDHAEPAPAAPVVPAGGRNLPVATAVGVLLGAAVLASLYVAKPLFVGVAALAVVVAVIELIAAIAPTGVRIPVPPVVIAGVAIVVAAYAGGSDGLVAAFVLACVVVVAWRAIEGVDGFVRDAAAGVFVLAYVPLLVAFAMLIVRSEDGAAEVVAVILLVACSDTGGFFAGSRFGKHRMTPQVSPKKSWEGFAGSVLLAGLVGASVVPLFTDLVWWQGLVLGLAVVATSTVGDLGESLIKRDLGIKDMSNLLPGHGGLLDRIDSLLVTIPVAWMLLAVLLRN